MRHRISPGNTGGVMACGKVCNDRRGTQSRLFPCTGVVNRLRIGNRAGYTES